MPAAWVAPCTREYERLKDCAARGTLTDPFKQAVAHVLCGAEPLEVDGTTENVEDFVWQKLSFALSGHGEARGYAVADLRAKIREFGPAHFDGRRRPFVYAQLLLLALDFERAVAFLADGPAGFFAAGGGGTGARRRARGRTRARRGAGARGGAQRRARDLQRRCATSARCA